MRGQRRNTHAHHVPTTQPENCDEQWNAVKPATPCTWIQGQTATASIDLLQVNKKLSRLALGHMPDSYLMGTAKAEDEYFSTPHMPPLCGQGKPYL